jgi:mono/diheme cytochrome c family protein
MKLSTKRLKTVVIAAMTLSTLALMVLFQTGSQAMVTPADEGAAIFKAKCAACHGADGSSNTPAGKSLKIRNLRSAEVQAQSDAQLFNIISKGKGKMTAYGKSLGDDKVHQLVAFVRTLR